jgi:hypothetical protein
MARRGLHQLRARFLPHLLRRVLLLFLLERVAMPFVRQVMPVYHLSRTLLSTRFLKGGFAHRLDDAVEGQPASSATAMYVLARMHFDYGQCAYTPRHSQGSRTRSWLSKGFLSGSTLLGSYALHPTLFIRLVVCRTIKVMRFQRGQEASLVRGLAAQIHRQKHNPAAQHWQHHSSSTSDKYVSVFFESGRRIH